MVAMQNTQDLDWIQLVMGVVGGLALFLLGMSQITVSLKAVAGERLRTALARLSSNRFVGAVTGASTTAIIQSSSVTTVLVVGFVAANLISVTQAASVIIGANLGTTITAQVIALDITEYALGLLALGAAAGAVAKRNERLGQGAAVVIGLAFVFLGLDVMSEAMAPLRTYDPFRDLLADASTPLVGLALGAAFTALVQSSSATTGIVVVMAADGLLGLETGIAIILGANIGTCVTALIASIGKTRDALRAALVHVLVNLIGALAWIGFVGELADLARWMSGTSAGLSATPRELANAHTAFNIVNAIVFTAMLRPLVGLTDKLVPARIRSGDVPEASAAYLDESVLGTPVLALEGTRREIMRLGLGVREMLANSLDAFLAGTMSDLDRIEAEGVAARARHGAIVTYIGRLGARTLDADQRREMLRLLEVANELTHMADQISVGMLELGRRRLENLVQVSDQTREALAQVHQAVLNTLDNSLEAIGTGSAKVIDRVMESKVEFHHLEALTTDHLADRLGSDEPRRMETYAVEIEIVENLRRVHQSCRRIARAAGAAPPASPALVSELA